MALFEVGMKVYSNDWYLKYNLSYEEAARTLKDWGVSFVLAQSRTLPMVDTAVKSEVPPELAERYSTYDDRKFRDALAKEGIEGLKSIKQRIEFIDYLKYWRSKSLFTNLILFPIMRIIKGL